MQGARSPRQRGQRSPVVREGSRQRMAQTRGPHGGPLRLGAERCGGHHAAAKPYIYIYGIL